MCAANTLTAILDAQQDLSNAQVNLIIAQHGRIVGSYAVAQAIGRLTLEAIEAGISDVHAYHFGVTMPTSMLGRDNGLSCSGECRAFAPQWSLRSNSDQWSLRSGSDQWPLRSNSEQ